MHTVITIIYGLTWPKGENKLIKIPGSSKEDKKAEGKRLKTIK